MSSGQLVVYSQSLAQIITLNAHSSGINRIKQILTKYVATASNDNTVKIWNPFNNAWSLIRTYSGHTANVYGLEYMDSDTMISGSSDQTIHVWSIGKGQLKRAISVNSIVYCLQMLANGYYLASGLSNNNINIYDLNTGNLVKTLSGHTQQVEDLALIGFFVF